MLAYPALKHHFAVDPFVSLQIVLLLEFLAALITYVDWKAKLRDETVRIKISLKFQIPCLHSNMSKGWLTFVRFSSHALIAN